jgi:hypothetical protein
MAAAKSKSGSRTRSRTKSKSGSQPKSKVSSLPDAAKVPLLAGGAALAGAAGGLALGSKMAGRTIMGVRLPRPRRAQIRSKDVAEAARSAAGFVEQVGELAAGVRSAQDKPNGKRNSPLEVLLQGLTARR